MQTSASFHEGPSQSFTAQPSAKPTSSGSATFREVESQPSQPPAELPTESSSGKCRHLPEFCKFTTYSIILSPCVADFPWVADDLLSSHGVTEFLRYPKEWLNDQNATAPGSTRRKRKIALVDTRRREATVAFLRSIEAAQLKRRNGDREYVPVYDWRVLEKIREDEQKYSRNRWKPGTRFDITSPQGIWKRFWVGLA